MSEKNIYREPDGNLKSQCSCFDVGKEKKKHSIISAHGDTVMHAWAARTTDLFFVFTDNVINVRLFTLLCFHWKW